MRYEIGDQVLAVRDANAVNHEPAVVIGFELHARSGGASPRQVIVRFADGYEAKILEDSPALKPAAG
jgi:hypothetical protein